MGKKYRAVNKGIVIRANWAIIWKSCETSSFSLEPSENDDFIMVLKNQICDILIQRQHLPFQISPSSVAR